MSEENENLKDVLKNQDLDKNDYENELLEIYKLMVNTSENVIQKRQNINSIFLTINMILLSAEGFIFRQSLSNRFLIFPTAGVTIAAIISCYLWHKLIKSSKQLNSGKFEIIDHLEDLLPVAVFRAEWKALEEGQDPKVYESATKYEMKIPLVFLVLNIVIYLGFSVFSIIRIYF